MPFSARCCRWLAPLCIAVAAPAAAQPEVPSFAELEAAGAVIGEIRVDTHSIFDLGDPHESGFAYRLANALHIKTRPELIRRSLLFKSGERLSVRVIEETERLIRATSTVYDVTIRPLRYGEGVVDLEVVTRDTWTLQPGAKLRREGGRNSGAINVKETNLAGTGTTLGFERSTTVDRTGSSVQLSHDHLFDGWTAAALEHSSYNDGSSESLSLSHPFYALDTRWAAGASDAKFNRLDSLYAAGDVLAKYRHRQEIAEFYAGASRGPVSRSHRVCRSVSGARASRVGPARRRRLRAQPSAAEVRSFFREPSPPLCGHTRRRCVSVDANASDHRRGLS